MRSKPGCKSQRRDIEDNSYLSIENAVLKSKNSDLMKSNTDLSLRNSDLAKALTESKLKCAKLQQDVTDLQRCLFESESENANLKETSSRMVLRLQLAMEKMVSASGDIAFATQEAKKRQDRSNNLSVSKSSVRMFDSFSKSNGMTGRKSDNRMQAVKPMVSGHTILRPTITLQRVPTEQLEQLMINSNDENGQTNVSQRTRINTNDRGSVPVNLQEDDDSDMQEDSDEEGEVEEPADNFDGPSANSAGSFENNRLVTIQEENDASQAEDENNFNSSTASSSQGPLFSGIFKDVRVYISPMRNFSGLQKPSSLLSPRPSRSSRGPSTPSRPSARRISSPRPSTSSSYSRTNSQRLSAPPGPNSTASAYDDDDDSELPDEVPTLLGETTVQENFVLRNGSLSGTRRSKVCCKRGRNVMDEGGPSTGASPNFHEKVSTVGRRRMKMDDNAEENLNDLSTIVNCVDTSMYQQNLNAIDPNTNLDYTQDSSRSQLPLRNVSIPISGSNTANSVDDYDPMEGPSSLFEQFNENLDIPKGTMLNVLGLAPKLLNANTSTPNSPLRTRVERSQAQASNKTKGPTSRAPLIVETPTKITRRKYTKKEKMSLDGYTNCRVNVSQMSKAKLKASLEVKRSDSNDSAGDVSPENTSDEDRTLTNEPVKRSPRSPMSGQQRRPRLSSPIKKSKSTPMRKRKLKRSPLKVRSPIKRRRNVKPGMFKEPSLNKKMRRSK